MTDPYGIDSELPWWKHLAGFAVIIALSLCLWLVYWFSSPGRSRLEARARRERADKTTSGLEAREYRVEFAAPLTEMEFTKWLKDNELTLKKIRSWAIHPGGPRIVSAVAESLHLPEKATAASRQVLARCGNMSSPTLLFILEELRRTKSPRPCVAMGFGPGLAVETALLI